MKHHDKERQAKKLPSASEGVVTGTIVKCNEEGGGEDQVRNAFIIKYLYLYYTNTIYYTIYYAFYTTYTVYYTVLILY